MRNKIVHNANISSTLLPIYSKSCASFSSNLIFTAISKRCTEGIETFPDLFASICSDYDILIERLQSSDTPSSILASDY